MSHIEGDPQVQFGNLLCYDQTDLEQIMSSLGEKPYRAKQLLQAIHQKGLPLQDMTTISQGLRKKLAEMAHITPPEIVHEQVSSDGTYKWLMRVGDKDNIETVFIPEKNRGTLCVSSQIGCALNCRFCSTATQGFSRNLTVSEIIGQVYQAVRRLSQKNGEHDRQITNVVMMGMGEPLLNFEHVVKAMNLMMNDHTYGLSKRRVTLSTSGVVPAMYDLARVTDASLAVSLHAPNNILRDQLVPVNKKYPLEDLMKACQDYFPKESRRRITFEYVMLYDVNDSLEHARALVKLLQGIPAKINLIPFNTFPGTIYRCSDYQQIVRFRDALLAAGMNATIRKTRGDDVNAACGQLVGNFTDKTRRRERHQKAIGVGVVVQQT